MTRLRLRHAVAVPLSLLALGLAGCGDSEFSNDQNASSDSGSGGGVELKVGTFSWTAADVQTQIIGEIAKRHPDLGVSGVKPVKVDPAAGWVGLGRGDLDVLPEVNLPNQQTFVDEAKGRAKLVSETYGGATQGWFVPRYVVEGADAPAKGLTSVDQLGRYADVFKNTLYDSDPGWVTSEQNEKRLKGFDLPLKQSNSSEAALVAQVKRAYQRREPIVFYFFHPHPLFQSYDLVQLKEPAPYQASCFTEGNDRCANPTLAANIAVNDELQEKAPKFQALLSKVKIPLKDVEALQVQVDDKGQSAQAAAKSWVDAHAQEIDQWAR